MGCNATDRLRIRRKVGRVRIPDLRHRIGGIVGSMTRSTCWGVAVLVIGLFGPTAGAQVFDSGSNGSDGALDFSCPTPPCEFLFDPVALGLDLDGDNVFHFTTITVPAGVTVRLRAFELNYAPVHWLASGAVDIAGTVDLNGEAGHPAGTVMNRSLSMPGPGGFPGGVATLDGDSPSTAGFGPGGGPVPGGSGCCTCSGNGGGYGTAGTSWNGGVMNNTYGNVFVLPLIGGSGGSGGTCISSRGGGAGGGALLIAGSESITINGEIKANGGEAAGSIVCSGSFNGGVGSGGAIRLLAPVISGTGTVSVRNAIT